MSKQIQLVSPVDGSIIAEREEAGDAEMRTAVEAANAAFDVWKRTGVERRAALCHKAIDIMRDNAAELAEEIT